MNEQKTTAMLNNAIPVNTNKGLYDERYEHDACGIGFVAKY